jgi:hypothetical protein
LFGSVQTLPFFVTVAGFLTVPVFQKEVKIGSMFAAPIKRYNSVIKKKLKPWHNNEIKFNK